jgi:hypothetical protein
MRAGYFKSARFVARRPASKDFRLPHTFDVEASLAANYPSLSGSSSSSNRNSRGHSTSNGEGDGSEDSEDSGRELGRRRVGRGVQSGAIAAAAVAATGLEPGALVTVRGLKWPASDNAPDVASISRRRLAVRKANASNVSSSAHPLQEYAGVVGQIVEVMKAGSVGGSSPGNSGGSSSGSTEVRVLLGHDVWRLPATLLAAEDPDGTRGGSHSAIGHGSLGCGPGALLRSSHLWRLTASSTFCVEPAGDTPTRSHFYVAALSGCIPVLLDGDAPQYHTGPTPWAFRSDDGPAAAEDEAEDAAWAALDYRKFTVRFNASSLATGAVSLASALQAVPLARVEALRRALDAAAPLLRYAPHGAPLNHDAGPVASSLAAVASGASSTRPFKAPSDAFDALLSILEAARLIDRGTERAGSGFEVVSPSYLG